ncbi:Subtilase family protein [Paenimyroides ummariense]|uniref:Subtilase family protein n=1 Tax=Paenimyroides ummariense TaxID=913024 RepID=A0A1I4X2Z6_9FLAO|nr:S8 family peptidase [Paenimyroides ummariense]SFN20022.1 Subtilase family protein [Paenimyroides ummariense]
MKINKSIYLSALVALALTSCKTAQTSYLQDLSALKPIESADQLPTRKSALAESSLQRWSHLDVLKDTVPGMSVDRAYEEIIKNKAGKKVIVAVIDSGIEVDHADLKTQMWVNPKEVANNGKDDDKNGYTDDIHGWNFLGETNEEQLELTRIVSRGDDGTAEYKRAVKELEEKRAELDPLKARLASMQEVHDKVAKYLKKSTFTKADLDKIPTDAPADITKAKNMAYALVAGGKEANEYLKDFASYVNGQLDYNLNPDFKGRKTGDDIFDINDKIYGNNDVMGDRDHAKHGTHVAGIIAQTRHNNIGGDGVASNNVEIMSVRAVPDGDEYDKDIALGIRYAVDNGAKVINGSFGKYFAQNSQWVYDAIKYAEKKDVLIVVAAGNDAMDLNPASGEEIKRYPNDRIEGTKTEIADNFLVVGALNPSFGEKMVANFSNFGNVDVDVFAPGVKIYATVPHGKYEYLQGTSMASPNAAGVAAMIRSYYPNLKAAQVKKIMMDSGVAVNKEVIVSGDKDDKRNFQDISTSGKFVNLYNALIMADKVSKGKK